MVDAVVPRATRPAPAPAGRSPGRLDLVIPAYNEEHRIDRTLHAYRAACTGRTRFIVALDGCSDGTAQIVRDHARQDDRVVLLDFPKFGKGGVLAEAFRRCDAELVGFVDADCATPPGELLRLVDLVNATDRTDGAIASRRHPAAVLPRRRTIGRRLASTGFATFMRVLFRLPYTDTQCGAKVLRRRVVEEAMPFMSSRDFLFDVDLLLVARRLGFRIAEVPTVWTDQSGSRLRAGADARKMLASALRLWVHHRVLPIEAGPDRSDGGHVVIDLRDHTDRHPAWDDGAARAPA